MCTGLDRVCVLYGCHKAIGFRAGAFGLALDP